MRRSALARKSGLSWIQGYPPKRTSPKRTEEEQAARALVRTRSQGWCEMQLTGCSGRATDFSHRIRRSQGGHWTASNGLDACRMCHTWVTERTTESNGLGLTLESWQDPTVEPVAYQNAGFVRLDDEGGLWPVGE